MATIVESKIDGVKRYDVNKETTLRAKCLILEMLKHCDSLVPLLSKARDTLKPKDDDDEDIGGNSKNGSNDDEIPLMLAKVLHGALKQNAEDEIVISDVNCWTSTFGDQVNEEQVKEKFEQAFAQKGTVMARSWLLVNTLRTRVQFRIVQQRPNSLKIGLYARELHVSRISQTSALHHGDLARLMIDIIPNLSVHDRTSFEKTFGLKPGDADGTKSYSYFKRAGEAVQDESVRQPGLVMAFIPINVKQKYNLGVELKRGASKGSVAMSHIPGGSVVFFADRTCQALMTKPAVFENYATTSGLDEEVTTNSNDVKLKRVEALKRHAAAFGNVGQTKFGKKTPYDYLQRRVFFNTDLDPITDFHKQRLSSGSLFATFGHLSHLNLRALPDNVVWISVDGGHHDPLKCTVCTNHAECQTHHGWEKLIDVSRTSLLGQIGSDNSKNTKTRNAAYVQAQNDLARTRLEKPVVGETEEDLILQLRRLEANLKSTMVKNMSNREKKRLREMKIRFNTLADRLANKIVAAARKAVGASRKTVVIILWGNANWNGTRFGASYANKIRAALQRLDYVIVVDVPEYNTSQVCIKCNDPLARLMCPFGDLKTKKDGSTFFPSVRGSHACLNCHEIDDRDFMSAKAIGMKAATMLLTGRLPDSFRSMSSGEWREYLLERIREMTCRSKHVVNWTELRNESSTSELFSLACALKQSETCQDPQHPVIEHLASLERRAKGVDPVVESIKENLKRVCGNNCCVGDDSDEKKRRNVTRWNVLKVGTRVDKVFV
jgi:hypothetical protein